MVIAMLIAMLIVMVIVRSSFSALQAVCESCYQLYREPEVHSLCRSMFIVQ